MAMPGIHDSGVHLRQRLCEPCSGHSGRSPTTPGRIRESVPTGCCLALASMVRADKLRWAGIRAPDIDRTVDQEPTTMSGPGHHAHR